MHGDHYPDNREKIYAKRIIGLPAGKVEIISGKVYINDSEIPLDDGFIREETHTGDNGPYYVPEGCCFMLGDNRNNSEDSRFWTNKYVPIEDIIGKVTE